MSTTSGSASTAWLHGGFSSNDTVGVEVGVGPSLRGRSLRFVLVDELMRRGQVSVRELVAAVESQGFSIAGRASKSVSDALRWEVARGRVVRVSRGVYRFGSAPVSTVRRIRLFAKRCRWWVVAVMRGERPPPTPPDRRSEGKVRAPTAGAHPSRAESERPPWENLGWLWSA